MFLLNESGKAFHILEKSIFPEGLSDCNILIKFMAKVIYFLEYFSKLKEMLWLINVLHFIEVYGRIFQLLIGNVLISDLKLGFFLGKMWTATKVLGISSKPQEIIINLISFS